MGFQSIKIEDIKLNPMTMIGCEWWLITAGTEANGYNTMTASWGHLGAIWERPEGKAHMGLPTAVVYIRPHRYTRELMDREDTYTLSVFEPKYRKALAYLGTHSGRDENKVGKTELTPVFENGITYFEEAKMVLICKKIYHAPLVEEGFVDRSLIDSNYKERDFHEMYVGEIRKVLIRD